MRKTILKLSLLTLVVFSSSSLIDQSYAYWASGISSSSNTTNTSLTTGTWTFGNEQYDPNTSYTIGDIVTNNGSTYEAKKDGLLKEPGVDGGWKSDWTQIG